MSSARIKALAKLLFLIGLPISLLVALFAVGVHVGVGNRAAILGFEKEWLGMDVVVPAAPASGPWLSEALARAKRGASEATPGTTPEVKPPGTTPEVKPPGTTPEVKPPETTPPETTPPETTPPGTTPPGTTPPVKPVTLLDAPARPAMPLTLVLPEPLGPDLQAIARAPVDLTVKVYIDGGWARAADPFAYVQRTLEWASQVYDTQIGVRLELRSIALWDDAPAGMRDKLAALCARPDDGADLLLAFVSDHHGDPAVTGDRRCAVVPQSPRSVQAPHLRPLLFVVGRLLGAAAIVDPTSDAWARTSWMADVLADDAAPLWIDAASREAMLRGKAARGWSSEGAGADALPEGDH